MSLIFSEYVPIPFTVDGTPPPDPGPGDDPAGDLLAAAPLERALASLGVPVLETLCRQAGEVELEIPAPDGVGDPSPVYRVRVGVGGLVRDGALRTAERIRDALLSRHPGLAYPDPKDRQSLSERFLRNMMGRWISTTADSPEGNDGGGGGWAWDWAGNDGVPLPTRVDSLSDGDAPDPRSSPFGAVDACFYT